MNALRDRELRDRDSGYRDERPDYREQRPAYREPAGDREISLGTGTILGIFFALALTCAVFFGFGYSVGRRSAPPAVAATEATAQGGLFSSSKPSAGNPLGTTYLQRKEAARVAAPTPADFSNESEDSAAAGLSAAPKQSTGNDPAPIVKTLVKPSAPPPTPQAPMPATNANGTAMVQVAAVSHQEDADLLLSALKKRGYAVFIRQEAQDRLLHVQVGPFASKKDADVMRGRLLADGYNAIVK